MNLETLWPEPDCDPLGPVSYSEWARIRACVIRAAFARDVESRHWERGSTWTALGNARHSLLEEIQDAETRGLGHPSAAWVRSRFDVLLSFERDQLVQQWTPASVPPVKAWRDAVPVRTRMAHELGRGEDDNGWPDPEAPVQGTSHELPKRTVTAAPAVTPDPGSYRVEATIVDPSRNLYGRVDRLENRDGKLVVVDFKTSIGTPREQILSRHRDQMLFYAGLVEATFSQWPQLELRPVTGPAIGVSYIPDDVERLRESVDRDRSRFNAALEAGALASSSRPSSSICSWCPFQVVCPALISEWDAAATSGGSVPRALSLVTGSVTTVSESAVARSAQLDQPIALSAPAGAVSVTMLPAGLTVEPGDTVVAAGVEYGGGPALLRARWDSRIRVVKPANG